MNRLNVDEDQVLESRPLPPNTPPQDAAAPQSASKKPGGGTGAPAAGGQVANALDVGKMLGELIGMTCNKLIAPKRGEHWRLTDEDVTMVGQAYGAVLMKYFPDANFGVEVTAVVVTGMVFGPRLVQDRKNRRQPTAESEGPAFDPDVAPKATGKKKTSEKAANK